MSEPTTETEGQSTATGVTEDPTPFGWLNTADHKRVGRLFIVTSLLMLALALVLDALVRLDLTDDADHVVLDGDTFAQMFALSRESLVLLFLIPAFLGVAMYIVPLQVGAANLAFPRAATAAYWSWVVSAGVLIGAYLGNGGPYGGWSDGVDLHMLALGGLVLSLLMGAINVATTVLTHRSTGMFLDRSSPFAWSMLVTASMLIVSLPVLFGQLAILYVDHRYGTVFLGGNQGIWGRIDWIHEAPQLFIYTVPVLGIVAEIILGSVRRRVFEPLAMYFMIGLVGLFGFGAWANFSITNEGTDLADGFEGIVLVGMYGGATVGILGLLGLLGFAAFQARKDKPKLTTPLLAAFGAGTMMLLAALYGLVGAGADWLEIAGRGNDGNPYLRDTTWITGQQSVLIYGAGFLGLLAALHWWAPKIWGRSLNNLMGMLSLLLVAAGAALATAGPAIAGAFAETPDFVYGDPNATSLYADWVDASSGPGMAWLSLAGVLIAGGGMIVLKLNLLVSVLLKKGDEAEADPWSATAPEWMLDSPPAMGPMSDLPNIDSGTPLLDASEAEAAEVAKAEVAKEVSV
ncbi:MAG: cytochrome c oxidase subunit 1 [Candidatus Poriferisodalaceae bacterium]|jgi:cytochrome c oxidase subunit 1